MYFKRPTKAFEDAVVGGRTVILAIPGALPIEGGVPITIGGQIVGSVGVSGVTAQQDGQIAKASVDAIGRLELIAASTDGRRRIAGEKLFV